MNPARARIARSQRPSHQANGAGRPAASERRHRSGAYAEQQAAGDGHSVQPDVLQLSDSRRQEPLKPLVGDSHDEHRDGRRDQRRDVQAIPPHAIEQERDDAVLHEVEVLDGPDGRIGTSGQRGVRRGRGRRDGNGAVSHHPALAHPRQPDERCQHDRRTDGSVDDQAELPGEGVTNPASYDTDERRRQYERHGCRHRQRQPASSRGPAEHEATSWRISQRRETAAAFGTGPL